MTLSSPARNSSASRPFGSRLLGPAGQSTRALRVRVQLLLTALLVITNVVGAVLVLLISSVVVPRPAANDAMFLALAIGVPVYVVAALVVGVGAGTVTSLRALRWVYAEEPPDDAERTRTLRVPVRLTVLQFALWAGATALFTLLAVALQPERALGIGLTIGTAAIVVSGVAYLLSDFALRPIAARALVGTRLTDRPRGVGDPARGPSSSGRSAPARRSSRWCCRASSRSSRRDDQRDPARRHHASWWAASCSCSGCW